jgi:hypothetical protein
MSDNVKECEEKFFRLLQLTNPQTIFHDDTFQEKIISYLQSEGIIFCKFIRAN